MKYTVTVNQLRAHGPCSSGLALLETVSAELGLDPGQPVDFNMILDRGGFRYAAWALRTQPAELAQRVSIRFAELALPVWEAQYPDDLRPRRAIEAAKVCLADPSAANLQATHAARAAHAAYLRPPRSNTVLKSTGWSGPRPSSADTVSRSARPSGQGSWARNWFAVTV